MVSPINCAYSSVGSQMVNSIYQFQAVAAASSYQGANSQQNNVEAVKPKTTECKQDIIQDPETITSKQLESPIDIRV